MTIATNASSHIPATPMADRMAPVRLWLFGVAALVFLMVIVGGATRLTESGLSITEWRVVTGVLPPLSEAAWLAEFEKYKQIPQYGQLFPTMTLPEFKFIFYWEWGHRLLGRIIGVAFALPLAWFWWTGRVQGVLRWKLLGLLALGGLQGAVGWWMVASGLTQRTEVAPERLAVHLTLASITFVALLAVAMGLRARAPEMAASALRKAAGLLVAFLLFQIALGAFVAGSRAGLTYNTWPLMDGAFAPSWSVMTSMEPAWRNFFENHATVQFQHRVAAYLLLGFVLWHAWTARSVAPGSKAAKRAFVIVGLVLAQASIGVATLLAVDGRIPLGWGLLHQSFAFVVLGMATAHWRALSVR
ncbi:MAG: COX15/CtaA family protein [Beijerinckiaceae bacterium]|nr:COX15/CtaA family protein [Beijerinckiaceae bacterium]